MTKNELINKLKDIDSNDEVYIDTGNLQYPITNIFIEGDCVHIT